MLILSEGFYPWSRMKKNILPTMKKELKSIVLENTGASALGKETIIQELWSGYGKIMRVPLIGATRNSVIVKHVHWPEQQQHPRGWNSEIGHQRKLKSYAVETSWYRDYSMLSKARLPLCIALKHEEEEVIMVLEDLDSAGFSLRKTSLNWAEIRNCLHWLALFHASFMGVKPQGLWKEGTYWHLATRPQELKALKDQGLRAAAEHIDERLKTCTYQTLVHGDAKVANFCFSKDGQIAGLDFQYVGGGCGMKDLAYFIGSCLPEEECERLEAQILDTYFVFLQEALDVKNEALEEEWRALYYYAWADFHRFLKGWSPSHWKINDYSERICRELINSL